MIHPSLRSKELVAGLIELLSTSINHNLLDDAETLLACVRGLRPGLVEFDTFEAWISARRGQWADAIRTLHTVQAKSPNFPLAKALLAFCQYATGDAVWQNTADEVLRDDPHPDAVGLLRLLKDPDAHPAGSSAPPESPSTGCEMPSPHHHLRA